MTPPPELPPPPPGRTGWPWDAPPGTWPAAMPDGRPWPRLSIVTPSYNQGQFLEETIRSVLLQGYPNLEYLVVDGGSTDDSPAIIRKYAPWLARWVSERDAGQADAINKGLAWATGDWLNWINSDDWFAPDALARLALHFDGPSDVVYGVALFTDADGSNARPYETGPFSLVGLVLRNFIGQPATFFRRRLIDEHGPLSRSLTFALDYDLWLRWAVRGAQFVHDPGLVAYYRLHETSKSMTLLRTNQREVRQLLDGLVRDGLLPPAVAAQVPTVLRNQIEWNYARGDLPEFRRNVHEFVRRNHRPPTARMARQYLMSLVGFGPLRLVRAAKRAVTGIDPAAPKPAPQPT
jgi:glycosyltransferase involved in cell wall biosynthesis